MKTKTVSLNGTWLLGWTDKQREADLSRRPTEGLLEALVPGDIHRALLAAGKIGEPSEGENARALGWLGEKEWWFSKTFAVETRSYDRVELVFEGLDLIADIWLNGAFIGHRANMFREARISVGELLRSENELVVRLLPHVFDTRGIPFGTSKPSFQGSSCVPKEVQACRPWMRKAQYTFGWDWTQDVFSCGIWLPVSLRYMDGMAIEDGWVETVRIDNDGAGLSASCRTRSFLMDTAKARLTVDIYKKGAARPVRSFSRDILCSPGVTNHRVQSVLPNPELWWPAGYGDQPLYEAEWRVELDTGEVFVSERATFGVRTLRVEEKPRKRKGSHTFTFVVNDTPIYAKGADWVPADMLPGRVTEERLERALRMARRANMNYLRVWGGGFYETDAFYRLCDELGLMLWQDFMFSCAEYPDYDDAFMEELAKEIPYQVRRLRGHPSIVMWCGNNEISQQMDYDGYRVSRPNRSYYGETIFSELIPGVLTKEDPHRPYRVSSGCRGSYSAAAESHLDFANGVTHFDVFHEVWKKGPKAIPSFINEWYGGAPPPMKSIRQYLPNEKDRDWDSPAWKLHDFAGDRLEEKLKDVVPTARLGFADRTRYYQILQAEAVKAGAEVFRKHKWENSGQCYWQLNDAYPGFTWSLIDYYLREKPAYFYTRRALRPTIPLAEHLGDVVEIAVANDAPTIREGTLRAVAMDFSGRERWTFEKNVVVPANASEVYCRLPAKKIENPARTVLWMGYFENGESVAENRFFFDKIRNLEIPLAQANVQPVKKDGLVTALVVSGESFIREFSVTVETEDILLSDNYIDVFPGRPVTLELERPVAESALSFDWENRDFRCYDLLKIPEGEIQCVRGDRTCVTVGIFNPAAERRGFTLFARGPEGWAIDPEKKELWVGPGETCPVTITLSAPLAEDMADTVLWEVGLMEGGREYPIALRMTMMSPLTIQARNVGGQTRVTVRNRSEVPMGPVSLEVAWETTRVVSVESEIFSLKPNGVLTRSYPTADAQPYSFQATARGPVGFGATASVWLGGGPETFLGRFATRTLTDIRRLEATCIGRDPLPCLTTGYAYLLDPDIPSSIYDYIGGARARVWLFLHYSDDRFFIDAFVQGDRFSIPEDGVPHHGSCVEFGLSCSDRLGFEAVMSLTQNGPAIWQRGLDRHPQVPATKLLDRLRVEHRSKDHLVFYRLSLDWDWLSPGYSPKKGDIVKCAFVFLSGKGLGAGLFKGIQAGKEIARYGEIVLV